MPFWPDFETLTDTQLIMEEQKIPVSQFWPKNYQWSIVIFYTIVLSVLTVTRHILHDCIERLTVIYCFYVILYYLHFILSFTVCCCSVFCPPNCNKRQLGSRCVCVCVCACVHVCRPYSVIADYVQQLGRNPAYKVNHWSWLHRGISICLSNRKILLLRNKTSFAYKFRNSVGELPSTRFQTAQDGDDDDYDDDECDWDRDAQYQCQR